MLKRWINLAFVFGIFAVLLLSLVRTVFFPKDINYYENRQAEKLNSVSASAFLDGALQDNMEKALADQALFAQRIKKSYNTAYSDYIHASVTPVSASFENRYFKIGRYFLFGGKNLLYGTNNLSVISPAIDKRATEYNALFARLPDEAFYLYYIEKDTDINFQTGEKSGVYEYLVERIDLPEEKRGVFRINSFAEFDSAFYQTDHHWKAEGAHKGYKEVISLLLGEDEPTLTPTELVEIPGAFSGSKSKGEGTGSFSEAFSAYRYDFPSMTVQSNGAPAPDYGQQDAYMDGTLQYITYGAFYGDDLGEIIFDTNRPEKENVLIIGESYDNAILKLVASHFNRTVSIDLRYYQAYMGKAFSLEECLETNQIDKVLLIGNVDYFISEDFSLEK